MNGPEINWTPEALARLEQAPLFFCGMVKRVTEKKAREMGFALITSELMSWIKSEMIPDAEESS